MSVAEIQLQAKQVRNRLFNPPNAKQDHGIDLKRKAPMQITPMDVPEIAPAPETDQVAALADLIVNDVKNGEWALKIADIQRAVCAYYASSRMDMLSVRREKLLVLPRHVAMYLSKTLTPHSLPHIGRMFGGRDHTTILNAIRKIERLSKEDETIAADLKIITSRLRRKVDSRRVFDASEGAT